MTNAEQTLSYETVKHLDAWLARNHNDDRDNHAFWNERAQLRDAMMRLTASDEVWLDRGWWRVYDAVR